MARIVKSIMTVNGSYDKKLFTKPLSDYLECPICFNIMKDPVQCPGSCTFCRHCVSEHLNGVETCPTCANPMDKEKLLPNRLIGSMIGDSEVHCLSYESPGDGIKTDEELAEELANSCGWTGKLKDAEQHYKDCQFVKVECPNIGCEDMCLRKDLPEHIENCLHRLIPCKWCNLRRKIDAVDAHVLVCPKGCCMNALNCCVHYLCLTGWVYVFYAGHIDKIMKPFSMS
jgi:hypothetical protein